MNRAKDNSQRAMIQLSKSLVGVSLLFVICATFCMIFLLKENNAIDTETDESVNVEHRTGKKPEKGEAAKAGWVAPDSLTLPAGTPGAEIKYGRELIVHTAAYFGPKGKIRRLTNGMNCQNCHSEAGTKIWALNYSAVASTYPQFKARSNKVVSIASRINGCFERSLNGKKLDTASREMEAMIAYMKWLGKDVKKGHKPEKNAVEKLPYLDRAASPVKGRLVYQNLCKSCHGENGAGQLNEKGTEYTFPPLWGADSYNDGAGLYRLSNFAGFVKNNMPLGTSYEHPALSNEEAWDVAAFVNSQPRPHKDQSADWKDLAKKPIDFPFGPYKDRFSETQHKYGPFKPIANAQ